MERIRNLNQYQRVILILLTVLLIGFSVLYTVIYSRVGVLYADHILIPREENGTMYYSGRIRGEDVVFTVSPGQSVTLRWGERQYGPYTAREDPTAVPADSSMAAYMTGVEILEGDTVFFRGGVLHTGEDLVLFDEDGGYSNLHISYSQGDGTIIDLNGNTLDERKPSAVKILELLDGPVLTRKGLWEAWACGVVMCIVTAVSILYADELFRWSISFRVQDPDAAVPSDREIAGRCISWTLVPVMALVVFIIGLL